MRLAKPCIDIGLMTRQADAMATFWQDAVGATFEQLLPVGAGHVQHRFDLSGSVLKINAVDKLPGAAPSGYRELLVARADIKAPRTLHDPDGNRVTLVPPGHEGVHQIGVRVAVGTPERQHVFCINALGMQPNASGSLDIGNSTVLIEAAEPGVESDLPGPGIRYITVQIHDAAAANTHFLANGGREGTGMHRLGDVAIFAMVRDPHGNWIELSQRASLTGPLD